jgi:hypothetical protein
MFMLPISPHSWSISVLAASGSVCFRSLLLICSVVRRRIRQVQPRAGRRTLLRKPNEFNPGIQAERLLSIHDFKRRYGYLASRAVCSK